MTYDYLLFILVLFCTIYLSVKKEKLTLAGAITGGVIVSFLFIGAGFTGVFMLGVFFLAGTLATTWKINTKELVGVAESNGGKRTAGQVIANGGVAGIAGLLAGIFPNQQDLFLLMMAAAISSAISDTLSSELGTVYGKRFYNILSFKQDKRGENGVISIEGTIFGVTGASIIAAIYAARFGWNKQVSWIVIAGTMGNISDSILGATLERKGIIKNDTVNFLNTFIAALVVLILFELF